MIPEWKRLEGMRAALAEKQVDRDNELALQRKQQREVQLLQTNPEYLELVARDKLDLMKEGETIFRLQGATAEPVAPLEPPAPKKIK